MSKSMVPSISYTVYAGTRVISSHSCIYNWWWGASRYRPQVLEKNQKENIGKRLFF